MHSISSFVQRHPLGTFFGLTFALTWLSWGWLAVSGQRLDMASPTFLLFIFGGFGPSLAGVMLTYLAERRDGLRNLWRRTCYVHFGLGWYAVIVLLFPAIKGLTLLLHLLSGGTLPDLTFAMRVIAQPLSIIPVVVSIFIFGPLAEEYGWRGYALDRLQVRGVP